MARRTREEFACGEAVAKKHCVRVVVVSSVNRVRLCDQVSGFSFTRARVTVLVVTSRGCGDVFVVAPPENQRAVALEGARREKRSRRRGFRETRV